MSISISAYHSYSLSMHYKLEEYDVVIGNNVVKCTVTNCPTTVEEWISTTKTLHCIGGIHNRHVVGLDTEWRPSTENNPVAVLQLCIGRRCLIFQLLYTFYVPPSLARFLRDPNHIFVGVGVHVDAKKLLENCNLSVTNYVDLARLASKKVNLMSKNTIGLKSLASEVLGVEIVKSESITMSQWDNPHLSAEQVQYACANAYVSSEIGRIWRAWEPESENI
ncbi:Ribonuclease H-like superfamily [Sesbania bispinosa]|nr:Ribonuclease H-like superfamily [Sesbania bispinosa]